MLLSEDLAILGPALSKLRRRSRKTVRGVAQEVGWSKYTVWRFETGRRRPSIPKVLRYLDAVGADLRQLERVIGLMKFLRHGTQECEVNSR